MAWIIQFDPSTEKDLKKIGHAERKRIFKFLQERIAPLQDPRSIGESLRGPELGRFWKYRVGDYRIICDIRDKAVVMLVVRIGNRRDIYR